MATMRQITTIWLAFWLALFSLMATSFSARADTPLILDLRSGQLEEASRLVVETSEKMPVSLLLLVEPHRLVIDLPASRWRVAGKGASGKIRTPPMRGFRFGSPGPNVSRLVIDLDAPVVPEQVFWLAPDSGGHRLVIDLNDRGETAFRVAAQALLANRNIPLADGAGVGNSAAGKAISVRPPPQKPDARKSDTASSRLPVKPPLAVSRTAVPLPAPKPARPASPVAPKWVVFIDAGHGGKDPGAISISGMKEKDITLKAAKELARQLEATGQIIAILSRDDDRFHRLRKRIELARRHQADVFISLHADAARSSKARGVSVFTLSDTASDKEAAYLASQENKADLIGGPDLDGVDPDITPALLGIFQREAMNQSSILADSIIREFDGVPTPRRGHRFAGFAVLKSPDIPSVLIEMGFLTNRQDERNLAKAAYRRDLMRRITRAVLAFLKRDPEALPSAIPEG